MNDDPETFTQVQNLRCTIETKDADDLPDALALVDTLHQLVANAPFALSFEMTFEALA